MLPSRRGGGDVTMRLGQAASEPHRRPRARRRGNAERGGRRCSAEAAPKGRFCRNTFQDGLLQRLAAAGGTSKAGKHQHIGLRLGDDRRPEQREDEERKKPFHGAISMQRWAL